MSLPDRIKIIRGSLTFEKFAEMLTKQGHTFDKGNLSKYEKGKVKPSSDFYSAIAKIGINVNWLLTGEGEMYAKDCTGKKGDSAILRENEKLKEEIEVVRSEERRVGKECRCRRAE